MDEQIPEIAPERRTLSDGVYGYLHGAIITLRLEPGQMVYETELAHSLGVSRTPVREAFRSLLSEELIEVLPQRGARIAYISRKKVEEALFVRLSLEVGGFREVSKRWRSTNEHFTDLEAELRKLLEKQADCGEKDDAAGFLTWDEEFHRRILDELDNPTLLRVISSMRAHLNRIRYLELTEAHHYPMVIDQHERILKAVVENRDGEIPALMREHIGHLEYDFPTVVSKYARYFQE